VTEDKKLDTEEKEPIKVSFSLPQIAGGALAAATAAFLGSRLGVAGTIVGAAIASIIGGIGGTLYSAGIDRTHRKVTEAIQRGYEKVRAEDGTPTPLAADGGETRIVPAVDPDLVDTIFRTPDETTQVLSPVPASGGATAPSGGATPPPRGRRTRFWQVTLLSVGAIFLVALAAITVIEVGLGRSLDGSDGTTVSNVGRPSASASAKPTPTPTVTVTQTPTPAPTTSDPTPTATATQTSTEAPTAPATDQPTPAATATSS
jgi:hypothetical protein